MIDAWNGERVRLGDLAKVEMRPAPNIVLRENGSRRIEVHIDVKTDDLGAVAREVERRLQKVTFPLGYHAEVLGEYRERRAAFKPTVRFPARQLKSIASLPRPANAPAARSIRRKPAPTAAGVRRRSSRAGISKSCWHQPVRLQRISIARRFRAPPRSCICALRAHLDQPMPAPARWS